MMPGQPWTVFVPGKKRQNPEGEEDPYHHDFAILLTRIDICATGNVPCSTVGMALFGGMCSVGHSCSIVQDTGLNSAFTISQMIANSFGVTFDDGTTCGDDYIAFIMSSKRNNGKKSSKLAWSRCSRQQINHFLSKPRSRCLIDKPLTKDLDHMTGQLRLPGEVYDLDSQCQLNFGKQASFCRIMFGFVCRMLWCHTKQGKGGCTTTRSSSADGTHCGKDRWCLGGSCVPKVRSEPIDGNWGEWQEWSRCSRTCGGGIQRSSRECNNPRPAHGGSYCKGERQRIQICNKQICQSTEDFRDIQCSAFDQSEYVGRKFKWKGYYNKARECALVCKAVGSWYYRIMAPKVEDGTPCRPASYDRCVNGICMAVGCDYKLGSDAKEDECGVCLGNGSSCTVVENVYRKPRGIGYETIATIPEGSTSIAIREETASRNYLAIFGHKNKNLLNGNYRIERPGIYNKGGTILQYRRRGQLEGVWIKGPLSETIRIAILFQANNTGIRYKYSKPLNNRVRVLEKALGIFLWRQAANGNDLLWTTCSATCGKGHRIAVFDCVDAIRDSIVDDLFCSLKEKPELVQECQERTCPLPDVPVQWKRSSWGACSKSCGSGYQRRSVYCVRTDTQSLVNFKLCQKKKPRTVQTCNVHDCFKGNWRSSTWSACSEDCGPGTRYRNISCHGRNGKILDTLFCRSGDKPLDKESCEGTCAQWVTGYWSQCSSCSGTKTRCVICINKKTFLPSSSCDPSMKPMSTKPCMEDGCKA